MQQNTRVPQPVQAVFAHLADPRLLPSWLNEVDRAGSARGSDIGNPDEFAVQVRHHKGTGEVIGYEPPWYVAYRLSTDDGCWVIRISCAASSTATDVAIEQMDEVGGLTVNVAGLRAALVECERNG